METNNNLNIRGREQRAGGSVDDSTLLQDALDNRSNQANQNTESTNSCLDEINKAYTQVQDILLKASTIQASVATLNVGDEYKLYFDRIVRPSLDIIYLLSFAVQNTAAAANFYQSNAYGRKGEEKKALNISYDILEQMDVSLELLRCSLACLIEKSKCL